MTFDTLGVLRRVVDRPGGGPGEFKRIAALAADPSGRVHVFDSGNARYSVVDPETFSPVTEAHFQGTAEQALVLPDGRAVVNARIRSPNRIGFPLHFLSESGEVERSFGTDFPIYRPDVPFAQMRRIALGPQGQIWAAKPTEYKIEVFSEEGKRVRIYQGNEDWFRPYLRPRNPSPEAPPLPWISDLAFDEEGLLWLAFNIAGEEWKAGLGSEPDGPESRYFPVVRDDLFWDTWLVAIDTRSGGVVAQGRFAPKVVKLLQGGMALTYEEGEDGYPKVDLWRLRLREH